MKKPQSKRYHILTLQHWGRCISAKVWRSQLRIWFSWSPWQTRCIPSTAPGKHIIYFHLLDHVWVIWLIAKSVPLFADCPWTFQSPALPGARVRLFRRSRWAGMCQLCRGGPGANHAHNRQTGNISKISRYVFGEKSIIIRTTGSRNGLHGQTELSV